METKQSYNYEYRHLNNDSISKLLTPNWVTGFTDAYLRTRLLRTPTTSGRGGSARVPLP